MATTTKKREPLLTAAVADELDELFYGNPADHVNPMDRDIPLPVPPPPPPSRPQRPKNAKPHRYPVTEKERWAQASRMAKRQKAEKQEEIAHVQPKTTHQQQHAPAPTSSDKEHQPVVEDEWLFPHADDQRRLQNYIYMCTLSIVTTGKIGGVFEHSKCTTVTDIDVVEADVNALFRRFRKLRRALYQGMIAVIQRTGNPVLLEIVKCMDNSKLTVYSKPKYLHPNDEDNGGGSDENSGTAYDVWTLQKIPGEERVRGAALTPVSGTTSQPKPPPPEFMQRGPIMFHIDSEYVNVLKCFYTLMFFMDFLNSEITAKIDAITKAMPGLSHTGQWNAEIHRTWDVLFARDFESRASLSASGSKRASSSSSAAAALSNKDIAKHHPMHVFVEGIQKQLVTCCAAMQKIVGKDPFFIHEGPSSSAGN